MRKILIGLIMLFLSIILFSKMMKFVMLGVVKEKFKIFYSIIRKIAIYVMHYFFRIKVSAKMFFHYKTMFKNITLFVRERMIRRIYQNITISIIHFSTSPRWAIFSRKLRKFFTLRPRVYSFMCFTYIFYPLFGKWWSFLSKMSKTNFLFVFFRFFSSFGQLTFPKRSAFSRTAFPSFALRQMSFKTFITNNTLFKHLAPLSLLIIAFNIICYQVNNVYATEQWREDGSEATPLGTDSASDLDTIINDNIVTPLDLLLSNYKRGCQITYASASTLTVESGEAVVSNSDGSARLMLKNASNTTVSWADVAAGTSESASTTYYVWIFQQTVSDTDFDVCISTSSTAPAGKTYYRKLGSFYNDGSSNITLITNDDPEELSVYDSGWFAVSQASSYTKTHSLGTTKVIAKLWFSDSSTGASNVFEVYVRGPNDIGGQIYDLATTSLKVYTDVSGVAQKIIAGGSVTSYSSGYYRVIAIGIE